MKFLGLVWNINYFAFERSLKCYRQPITHCPICGIFNRHIILPRLVQKIKRTANFSCIYFFLLSLSLSNFKRPRIHTVINPVYMKTVNFFLNINVIFIYEPLPYFHKHALVTRSNDTYLFIWLFWCPWTARGPTEGCTNCQITCNIDAARLLNKNSTII